MTRPDLAVRAFVAGLALAPAALTPAAAIAQATPQGAADLTALFQTYLGSVPGVVNVVADGDAYAVTLDATPLFARIPATSGARAAMSPYRLRLADNGDGTWATSEDQPLRLEISVPGMFDISISAGRIACEGTFDARLKAVAESTCSVEGLEVFQAVQDPLQGRSETRQTIAAMTYRLTGEAGAQGGVDLSMTYGAKGIAQTMQLPAGPGMPPTDLSIDLAAYDAEFGATGMRTETFLRALAWFVAHPDPALMMQERGALKAILSEGLPLWDHLGGVLTGSGLVVNTPVGPASAETVEIEVEIAGAVEAGLFREAFRFAGVKPPPGVLPPFLEPLLPTEAGIDFAVEDYDAAAAAKLLLGLFDLPPGANPGPEFEGRMLQALMPQGTVTIAFPEGILANATYRLEWEGSMTAGPGRMPAGSGTVTATGYDAAMALVDALPVEMKGEILPVLGMARGLAKDAGDGTLVWEIDATEPGTFRINGMDLLGLQ